MSGICSAHRHHDPGCPRCTAQRPDPMTVPWYPQPNDLIGGWCVMITDAPPSAGGLEVADFAREEVARHIAALHNDWLIREQLA